MNRDTFLADPNLEIIGYQACFDDVRTGLYLFNHTCRTTLAVKVMDFEDLYEGPVYDKVMKGSDQCSGYCLDVNVLEPCSAGCKYARVREVIQIIRKWPKE